MEEWQPQGGEGLGARSTAATRRIAGVGARQLPELGCQTAWEEQTLMKTHAVAGSLVGEVQIQAEGRGLAEPAELS